jgi:dihydrodipicolinate synthase/N-acetylneuraminate lyase
VNLNTDTIKVMLTNTLPVITNAKYSDISGTELASAAGYTTGGATVSGTSVSNSSGVESLAAGATTWTSVTGNMGPFRYVVYYDSTPTDKPLIAWYDYGSSITLNGVAGETFVDTPAGGVLVTLT